jgi:aerobic carbon-monoxide dehydrogenase large subunit
VGACGESGAHPPRLARFSLPQVPFREAHIEGLEHYRQYPLARGRVRYVGDPVAAVLAEDEYQAEDAAEQAELEIEPLAPVLSAMQAIGEFDPGRGTEAALIHKGYGSFLFSHLR